MKNHLALVLAVALMSVPAVSDEPKPAASAPGVSTQPAEVNPKIAAFLKPAEVASGDTELRQKLKERHNSAVTLLELRIADYKRGLRDVAAVFEAARLTAEAKLDLAENVDQRGTILDQAVEVSKAFEGHLQKQVDRGIGSKADLERARFARLSAEVQLLKVRQKE
jgi:hypothetical protein